MTVRNNWQTVRRHNAVHIIYESSGAPWDFKTNAEKIWTAVSFQKDSVIVRHTLQNQIPSRIKVKKMYIHIADVKWNGPTRGYSGRDKAMTACTGHTPRRVPRTNEEAHDAKP